MQKSQHRYTILLVIFSLLLSACAPAAETAISSLTIDAAATPTSSPTSTPIPIPMPVVVDVPVTEVRNGNLLTHNDDGTFTVSLLDEGAEDWLYMAPSTPAYIWDIGYRPASGIKQVVFEVDILVNPDVELPIGYARKLFWIQLYNLETIAAESVHGTPVTVDTDEILKWFLWGEDLSRYQSCEESEGGGRRYTVRIPYEQFNGGKPNLVFQPLRGITFANPQVTILGSNGAAKEGVLDDVGAEYVHHVENEFLYDNWENEFGHLPEGYPGMRDRFITPDRGMLRNLYNHVFSSDVYMMPAADFGLEGEYVFAPEGLIAAIPLNRYWWYEKVAPTRLNDASIEFMRTHMVDPNTGLIHGIWDFSSEQLLETDRGYSNIALVAAFLDPDDYQYGRLSGENFEFLVELLLKAVEQEIVTAPNGQLVLAPRGADGDVINIRLQDFVWGADMFKMYHDILKDREPASASRLLEAYANTLQILLEAQEMLPTNLLPSQINVVFTGGDGYYFEYPADPALGKSVFDASDLFYYQYGSQWEMWCDELNTQMSHGGAFDHAYTMWILSLTPKERRDVAWAKMEQQARTFDNMYRAQFAVYSILYNTYRSPAFDGNYARYYSIETGEPVYAERDPSLPEQMSEFNARYGSIGTLMNWFQLAMFFHDNKKSAEIFELLTRAAIMVNLNVNPEGSPLDVSRKGFSVFKDGYIMAFSMMKPEISMEGPGNLAPWGQPGNLAWRETIDQLIQRLRVEYGMQGIETFLTSTPASP